MVTARYKLIFLSKENNADVIMEEEGITQLLSVSTLDSVQVSSDTLMKWDLNKIFVSATNVKLAIKNTSSTTRGVL